MAIPTEGAGAYGVEGDVVYSYPVTVTEGRVQVVEGLEVSDSIRARMKASEQELLEERAAVADLIGG